MKFQLEEKKKSAHKDYDPIVLSENLKINVFSDVVDNKISVEGTLKNGDKIVGRFTFNDNENQNRLFANVNLENMKRNTAREVTEAIASIIMQLVPAEDDSEENAG